MGNKKEFLLERKSVTVLVKGSESEIQNLFLTHKKYSFFIKTKFHNNNQGHQWLKTEHSKNFPVWTSVWKYGSKDWVLWYKETDFNYLATPSNPFPQNRTKLNHSDATSSSKICSSDVSKRLKHLNHPINIILVSLLLTLSMFYLLRKCALFKENYKTIRAQTRI